MGIFQRIGSLFKSNINDMISNAEDPEKLLNQVLVDMKQQLIESKKQVAVAIADEKRLKKQHEDEHSKVRDWERKAMMAIRAGDDDLETLLAGSTGQLVGSVRGSVRRANAHLMGNLKLLQELDTATHHGEIGIAPHHDQNFALHALWSVPFQDWLSQEWPLSRL